MDALDRLKLEAAGGITLSDDLYTDLLNDVNNYLVVAALLEAAPTGKELHQHAQKAAASFRQAAEFFGRQESAAQAAFQAAALHELDLDAGEATMLLHRWSRWAEGLARENKPTKGRAQANWPLQNAIRHWHRIWNETGDQGRGAYYDGLAGNPAGNFLAFTSEILSQAGKHLSENTILEQINIALKG